MIPYYPTEDDEGKYNNYKVETADLKLVKDYTGLNFADIQQLDIDEFLYLVREAFIYNKMQTEEGREYLENAYILTQGNPDREKLRRKFGGDRG